MDEIMVKKQVADQNFSLIVFGASGSLAKLKIFPSLYQLALEGRLDNIDYQIVGFARSELSQSDFRQIFRDSVEAAHEEIDSQVLEAVLARVHYYSGQYDAEEAYDGLVSYLEQMESVEERVRLVYFSVPPAVFTPIIQNIGTKLDTDYSKVRMILEKPFGHDLESAQKLKDELKDYDEAQLYLLDHYLGKESVFNILTLRYANSILTTLIKGKHVSNIQITAMEPVGIENRAGYFNNVGIFRDMIQSHLLQVLAFLVMSMPSEINAETLAREKRHVFEDLTVQDPIKSLVRGQYTEGQVHGEMLPSYIDENGVPDDSQTETFAAARFYIDNLRWHGVPIYVRSGKRLSQKWTSIVIEFKQHSLQKGNFADLETNKLLIQLQPQEKIEFSLFTKVGGTDIAFRELTTGKPIYCSGDCIHEHGRLLLEAMRGSQLLFLSFSEVFAAWKVVDPLIKLFTEDAVPLEKYSAGSSGPTGADKLVEQDGFEWHNFFPGS